MDSLYRLTIVERELMKQKVTVNPDALFGDIATTGHAVVYGIYFDLDSANIILDVENYGWSVDYATRRSATSPELYAAVREIEQLPDYVTNYWDDVMHYPDKEGGRPRPPIPEEGAPRVFVFHEEVPEGALDELREVALYPVVAEVSGYSKKDLKRYGREVQRIFKETKGVVNHWFSWNDGPWVGAYANVWRQPVIDRIESKVARVVPEDAVRLTLYVSDPNFKVRRDVCLRVAGTGAASHQQLAERVRAGTAHVTGPGVDCSDGIGKARPSGVCLQVFGRGPDVVGQSAADIARNIKQGKVKVTGKVDHCGALRMRS